MWGLLRHGDQEHPVLPPPWSPPPQPWAPPETYWLQQEQQNANTSAPKGPLLPTFSLHRKLMKHKLPGAVISSNTHVNKKLSFGCCFCVPFPNSRRSRREKSSRCSCVAKWNMRHFWLYQSCNNNKVDRWASDSQSFWKQENKSSRVSPTYIKSKAIMWNVLFHIIDFTGTFFHILLRATHVSNALIS